MTLPLLLSWDGEKMSGSKGNYIGLTEPPDEQFGKTMSIPDDRMQQWWELVAEQTPPPGEPMEQKLALARWIVARAHGEDAARAADERFASVVRRIFRMWPSPRATPSTCRPSSSTRSA